MIAGSDTDAADEARRLPAATLDVIILTRNEELNIPATLASVLGWVRHVFVVDSGSADATREIARSLGATVVEQPWLGYARQKNWALANLAVTANWVMILDADERVMPDLRQSIQNVLARRPEDVPESGFFINRYFVFLGARIRHCGYYPSYNLRLFKRGRARYEEREVHEHMLVEGSVGYLEGHLEHEDRRGLEEYMAKHNRYSTLEAREIFALRRGSKRGGLVPSLSGHPMQRRRWLKEAVYARLPGKWLFRFFFMYVVRAGFLDGLNGLRFCLFMSAYEMLVGLKLVELEKAEQSMRKGRV